MHCSCQRVLNPRPCPPRCPTLRRCDEGYYGHDCARRRAGLPLLPSRIPSTPWLNASAVEPPAALEPPPSASRLRPLIYVYDLEPLYQSLMLQYRCGADVGMRERERV